MAGRTGTPFRDAHAIVGSLVRQSLDEGDPFDRAGRKRDDALGPDAVPLLDRGVAVRRRSTRGGAGPGPVSLQLERFRQVVTAFAPTSLRECTLVPTRAARALCRGRHAERGLQQPLPRIRRRCDVPLDAFGRLSTTASTVSTSWCATPRSTGGARRPTATRCRSTVPCNGGGARASTFGSTSRCASRPSSRS